MTESFSIDTILSYMKRGGALAILLVVFGLFFNYYGVISLEKIPIPNLEIGLWIYLILNAGIATPFHYYRERVNPVCPQCGSVLKVKSSFSCPKCKMKFLKSVKSAVHR